METEGLREYMSKFGELEDCIVMKVRQRNYFNSLFALFLSATGYLLV